MVCFSYYVFSLGTSCQPSLPEKCICINIIFCLLYFIKLIQFSVPLICISTARIKSQNFLNGRLPELSLGIGDLYRLGYRKKSDICIFETISKFLFTIYFISQNIFKLCRTHIRCVNCSFFKKETSLWLQSMLAKKYLL